MSIDVVMPQMGESVAEGTIIKWMVKPGDSVEKDDPLFEISTDKVDAEVPSPASGVLSEIVVPEGETVEVGAKVAVIGGEMKGGGEQKGGEAKSAEPKSAEPKDEGGSEGEASPAEPKKKQETAQAEPSEKRDSRPAPSGGEEAGGEGSPVLMPQMGESVAEGTIIKWLVHEGDAVEKDDPLYEISTDKVDAEVPSPQTGRLVKILVPEGETVEVGAKVALISNGAGGGGSAPAAEPEAAPKAEQKIEPAEEAEEQPAGGAAPERREAEAAQSDGGRVRSSPIARRLAREHGVDLPTVPGTGRGGRVSKKDVLAYIEQGGAKAPAAGRPAAAGQAPAAKSAPAPVTPDGFVDPGGRGIGIQPKLEYGDEDAVVHPMTNMRRMISEHMVASRRSSAHVGAVFEIDFSRVFALRKKWKNDFQSRHEANLSVTTFVLHSLAPVLRAWPIVNASVKDGDKIEYHRHVNLGVAVALPDGLIVPVIRSVEQKGMGEIARELADLGVRARTKKLLPDEVSGSTFTVTNPGIFGAVFGIPIINQPNVAILGMGGVKKRVVVTDDDSIAIRPLAYFCMSYDHRILDGAVADQFLSDLKERIENFPEEILA